MVEREIYKYKDLKVRLSSQASDEMLYLLNNAVQGSEGGMRFSLQDVHLRIQAYKDSIRFLSLYKKDQLTGTIGSCFRISGLGNLRLPSSYLRYLSFQTGYQADSNLPRRERKVTKPDNDDSFKQNILNLFSKPHLLEIDGIKEGERHLLYAFLESMNERSKNLVNQAGYEYVRSFLTVAFSRFSPKVDDRVQKLVPRERPVMENLLKNYYRSYSLFSLDYAFLNDTYYILKENDEIIAGVSVIPGSYKIYDIPGVWGWVIMKVLPRMPFYKRLFHPEEFRYLVFDAIYSKQGHEKKLATLFESACAAEGYYTGLTWLDDRSNLYEILRTGVNMGILNRLLNAKPGLIYMRFVNFDEKTKELFYEAPAYVSGFDFS